MLCSAVPEESEVKWKITPQRSDHRKLVHDAVTSDELGNGFRSKVLPTLHL
jgi:hypothetical protein